MPEDSRHFFATAWDRFVQHLPGQQARQTVDIRQVLCTLVRDYGLEVLLSDANRCRGLLNDRCLAKHLLQDKYLTECLREINLLVSAVEVGVTAELLAVTTPLPSASLCTRLEQRLRKGGDIDEREACWTVESWAQALRGAQRVPRPANGAPSAGAKARSAAPRNSAETAPKPRLTDGTPAARPKVKPAPKPRLTDSMPAVRTKVSSTKPRSTAETAPTSRHTDVSPGVRAGTSMINSRDGAEDDVGTGRALPHGQQ